MISVKAECILWERVKPEKLWKQLWLVFHVTLAPRRSPVVIMYSDFSLQSSRLHTGMLIKLSAKLWYSGYFLKTRHSRFMDRSVIKRFWRPKSLAERAFKHVWQMTTDQNEPLEWFWHPHIFVWFMMALKLKILTGREFPPTGCSKEQKYSQYPPPSWAALTSWDVFLPGVSASCAQQVYIFYMSETFS